MANVITTNGSVSNEYYVLQINGRVDSIHRRYQDALSAGLQLKHQFPSDDIKVCIRNALEQPLQDSVLH
jgi:hypothetical protein